MVVHGGGPQIGAMLERLNIQSSFEGGLRVTDAKTVEVVEMVLAGAINKQIVSQINQEGAWAIGLCGKDGNMVFAEKDQKIIRDPDSNIERVVDLGFVGKPTSIDRRMLDLLANSQMIPVITAQIALGRLIISMPMCLQGHPQGRCKRAFYFDRCSRFWIKGVSFRNSQ